MLCRLRAWRLSMQAIYEKRLKERVHEKLHHAEIKGCLDAVLREVEKRSRWQEQVAAVVSSLISRVERLAAKEERQGQLVANCNTQRARPRCVDGIPTRAPCTAHR